MAKSKQIIVQSETEKALEAKVDAMFTDAENETSQTAPGAPVLSSEQAQVLSEQVLPEKPELPIADVDTESVSDVPEIIEVRPLTIDTPQTDAAIDDIVAQEADEVLAAQDAGIQVALDAVEPDAAPQKRGHPIFWFIILLLKM